MKLLLLVLFQCLCYSDSYKILVSYPLPIKSLSILGQAIVKHLLNDGHQVTYITHFPSSIPQSENFQQIHLTGNTMFEDFDFDISYILENKITANDVKELQECGKETARLFFQNENVTNFLEKNVHFDAVISDLFESEVHAGLAVVYNCPMVWQYSMGAHWQVIRLIADAANPAYDPDFLGTNTPPFSFVQRIQELWSRINWSLLKRFSTGPQEREIYESTFRPLLTKRGRELPDYEEVIYNASMIFGNEHQAIRARPSVPHNFIYNGGFHIDDPVPPLPKNLQELIDTAPHGVIYFSMGSFWKSKMLPMSLTRALLKVFAELKQTVIWKYEDDLKDLPRNVHIVHWAPQQSILAHHNCKFFISHGGLLSSIESVHFGVPIIGIPVMFDQFTNVMKAVHNGYAIKVDLTYNLPQDLKAAVEVMLNDEKYRNKAKELSLIYHDRPMKPGAEMVHWIKHVIRTRGALHLRSPAVHSALYQRLYLDLLALIIGIFFILYYVLCRLLKRGNANKVNKSKNE